MVKEYRPGTEWYGRPEYESGVRWIELEWEISNFHLNNVKNGFHPSMHINFPTGQPSDDEMTKIVGRTKAAYEGSENAGKVMVTFSPQESTQIVTFNPIELNTTDTRFLMLNDQVTDGILHAHRVTNPSLFGIATPGELGGRNDMLESLEIFMTQYVEPKQKLIQSIFNWFGKINGIPDKFIVNSYSPQFSKIHTNISDVLSILQSDIDPKQKYHLLVLNDYTHESAAALTDYHLGNDSKNQTETKVTNTQK